MIKREKTTITRVRQIFAYLPIYRNKFAWLKHITVIERKYITQELLFDEGWSYEIFWSKPYDEWIIEEIL